MGVWSFRCSRENGGLRCIVQGNEWNGGLGIRVQRVLEFRVQKRKWECGVYGIEEEIEWGSGVSGTVERMWVKSMVQRREWNGGAMVQRGEWGIGV